MNKEVQAVLKAENEGKVLCNIHGEVVYDESVKLKDARISALEGLLGAIQEHIDYLHNDVHCHLCGGGDCKPDCRLDAIQALFNKESFQKELEEGFLK